MIVLDTNVVSEFMKPKPDEGVISWARVQNPVNLVITAITVGEIHYGIERLPEGRRQLQLKHSFDEFLKSAFSGRVISFDMRSALSYATVSSNCEKRGHNTDAVDLMIAGTVRQYGARLATRNEKDFKGCDIEIINPWKDFVHPEQK